MSRQASVHFAVPRRRSPLGARRGTCRRRPPGPARVMGRRSTRRTHRAVARRPGPCTGRDAELVNRCSAGERPFESKQFQGGRGPRSQRAPCDTPSALGGRLGAVPPSRTVARLQPTCRRYVWSQKIPIRCPPQSCVRNSMKEQTQFCSSHRRESSVRNRVF